MGLANRSVTVWRIELDAPAPPDGAQILASDELARAERFLREPPRVEFVRSHVALRTILAAEVGTRPEKLRFATTPKGKPYLASPEVPALDFSLSHSGGLAIVGVSTGGRIGVDVERRTVRNELEIARRWFAPEEVRWLEGLAEPDRQRRFLECWTRKEAYLKAVATGLGGDLKACVCGPGEDDVTECNIVDAEHAWRLIPLDGPESAACAMVDFELAEVTVRDFSWETIIERR